MDWGEAALVVVVVVALLVGLEVGPVVLVELVALVELLLVVEDEDPDAYKRYAPRPAITMTTITATEITALLTALLEVPGGRRNPLHASGFCFKRFVCVLR